MASFDKFLQVWAVKLLLAQKAWQTRPHLRVTNKFGTILDTFGQVWNHFDKFRQVFGMFGQVRTILDHFRQVWTIFFTENTLDTSIFMSY